MILHLEPLCLAGVTQVCVWHDYAHVHMHASVYVHDIIQNYCILSLDPDLDDDEDNDQQR